MLKPVWTLPASPPLMPQARSVAGKAPAWTMKANDAPNRLTHSKINQTGAGEWGACVMAPESAAALEKANLLI